MGLFRNFTRIHKDEAGEAVASTLLKLFTSLIAPFGRLLRCPRNDGASGCGIAMTLVRKITHNDCR